VLLDFLTLVVNYCHVTHQIPDKRCGLLIHKQLLDFSLMITVLINLVNQGIEWQVKSENHIDMLQLNMLFVL